MARVHGQCVLLQMEGKKIGLLCGIYVLSFFVFFSLFFCGCMPECPSSPPPLCPFISLSLPSLLLQFSALLVGHQCLS